MTKTFPADPMEKVGSRIRKAGRDLRPCFGVDIDGVLCDTDAVMRNLIWVATDIRFSRDHITQYEYSHCIPIGEDVQSAVLHDFWKHCIQEPKPLDGAVEGLKKLRKIGRVWLITSRPKHTLDATKEYLQTHGFEYDSLIFSEDKKLYAPLLSLMIEDRYETAAQFASVGVPCLLMDAPWNSETARRPVHPLLHRVHNWDNAMEFVATNF